MKASNIDGIGTIVVERATFVMRVVLLFALFGVVGVVTGGTGVALGSEIRIATIDTQKVVEGSLAYKNIFSQLDEKQKQSRDSIQKEESKWKAKYTALEAQKNVLSKEALDARGAEIDREAESLRKFSYAERAIWEHAFSESMKVVIDKLGEIVKKYAESNGYDMVIERGAASYSKDSLSITPTVLEQLNKELPAVKVHFDKSGEMPKVSDKPVEAPNSAAHNTAKNDGGVKTKKSTGSTK